MAKTKKIIIGFGITLVSLLAYLSTIQGVIISVSPDITCEGSITNPCVSYFNITSSNYSLKFYNVSNQKLIFSPDVKDYKLYRWTYGKWRETKFPINMTKGIKYIFKIEGIKHNPSDVIKWSVLAGDSLADPIWYGIKLLNTIQLKPEFVPGDWNFTKNANITYQNNKFNISYKNYWVSIEPFVIFNGQYKTISDIKQAFPNMNIKDKISDGSYKYKFVLNYSNIPQNLLNNTEYLGFRLVDSGGLTWDDVERYDDCRIILKGKVLIEYCDLVDSNFTIDFVNKTYLLIGNIKENYKNGMIYLDPTVQLLPNTTNMAYYSGSLATQGTPDSATTQFSDASYNKTNVSDNNNYVGYVSSTTKTNCRYHQQKYTFNLTGVNTTGPIQWIQYCHEGFWTSTGDGYGEIWWYNVTSVGWAFNQYINAGSEATRCKNITNPDNIYNSSNGIVKIGTTWVGCGDGFIIGTTTYYTDFVNLTVSYSAGDTCDYSSGTWNIDCSENCIIDTATDVAGNDIIFTGTGTISVDADIYNFDDIFIESGCDIAVSAGKLFAG